MNPTNRTDEVARIIRSAIDRINPSFDGYFYITDNYHTPPNNWTRIPISTISEAIASAITSAVEQERAAIERDMVRIDAAMIEKAKADEREKVKKAAKFLFDNGYIDKKEYTLEDVEEAIAAIRQTPTQELDG